MAKDSRGGLVFIKPSAPEIGDGVKRLLGCYPAGKPSDPQVYVAAVTAVLAKYPNEIVREVTDPVRGLPSTCKFLPSIAELMEACGKAMAPYWKEYREAERAARDAAEREETRKYRDSNMRAKVNTLIEKWKKGAIV